MFVFTVALALASAATANRAKVGPLVPVSGASPFPAQCPGVTGTPLRDAEAEPYLAVDPRNPRRLVAAWIQDPMIEGGVVRGGALGNVTASTRNGGRSWRTALVPGLSFCTDGEYERAADPWLAWGLEGTAYLSSLPGGATASAPAIIVHRSADGGRTWSEPSFPDRRTDPLAFDDKESITADPFREGVAYVVWRQNRQLSTPAGPSFRSDIYFSRTPDRGHTWSPPKRIHAATPTADDTVSEVVAIGRKRLVCVFSTVEERPGSSTRLPGGRVAFLAIHSRDGGQSWSSPSLIGETRYIRVTDPERATPILPTPNVFTAEGGAGRRGRRAYVAWQDPGSIRSTRILLSSSKDGQRWSRPRLVSRGTSTPFSPDLAVARDGTVGVRFYDLRNDVPDDAALTTDSWFRHSHDRGRSWREVRLGQPFDVRTAPLRGTAVGGLFLGDYEGLVASRRRFATVFARSQPAALAGPTDIFFARIGLKRRGR